MLWAMATAGSWDYARLDPLNRRNPVERPVEGRHCSDARRLGCRRQVRLSKMNAVHLVDLERPQEQGSVLDDNSGKPEDCAHKLGHPFALDVIDRFEDIDNLGH